ncbi:hypothetical protein JCM14108_1543 [Lentilactobacillus farraginis DSM 18382 = JCM 14108]|uniref:ABC transporter Uup C-terminal domain-containing protein n=1 Tax=Lentilactobacillus farraginis DSM 18382 = JCM 14108 TaxID=1423743 RepID=X0PJ38_9LACO|nr:hypothetical protein JCM14108_1543 [Lentilactobacillus farraginis DSM 18382 = JCM 14108]
MDQLSNAKTAVETQMTQPDVFNDLKKSTELQSKLEELNQKIEQLENKWEEKSLELEELE